MKCQGNKHIKRQSDGKSEGEMQWPCSTALKSVFKGDAGGGGVGGGGSIWVVRYDVCTGCLVIFFVAKQTIKLQLAVFHPIFQLIYNLSRIKSIYIYILFQMSSYCLSTML